MTHTTKAIGRLLQHKLICNVDRVHREVGAAFGVIDRLTALGVFSSVLLEAHAQAKLSSLEQVDRPGCSVAKHEVDANIINY